MLAICLCFGSAVHQRSDWLCVGGAQPVRLPATGEPEDHSRHHAVRGPLFSGHLPQLPTGRLLRPEAAGPAQPHRYETWLELCSTFFSLLRAMTFKLQKNSKHPFNRKFFFPCGWALVFPLYSQFSPSYKARNSCRWCSLQNLSAFPSQETGSFSFCQVWITLAQGGEAKVLQAKLKLRGSCHIQSEQKCWSSGSGSLFFS